MAVSCEGVLVDLAAYEAGWLEPARQQAVEEHLASCSSCSAAAARDRRVVEALGAIPDADPPPADWRLVLLRHGGAHRPQVRWSRPAAVALVGAAAALALFLAPRGANGPVARTEGPDVACLMQAHQAWSAGGMAGDPNRAVLLSAAHRQPGSHTW